MMYNNLRQINLCFNCSLKIKSSQKVCASVGIHSARETSGILLNVRAAISQKNATNNFYL